MSVINIGMSPKKLMNIFVHSHRAWEIVLNLEGFGTARIGEKDYLFEPGQIICQPPDIPHTKYSEKGFVDIYIQTTHFSLKSAADENGVAIFQDDTEKSFETLMMMAHRIFHAGESNDNQLANMLYDALDQFMTRWTGEPKADKDIEQMKHKIIGSFSDPQFTIGESDEESLYSKDHLRRRFKKATGKTPIDYLTSLRIEHAKKLLKENQIQQYSMAQVGMMSGYYDCHYFSRIFKHKVGMSPKEYAGKLIEPVKL